MITDSVPPSTADRPVTIPRTTFELLALIDFTTSGRRLLDILTSRHAPEDGSVAAKQRELAAALGIAPPAVTRGFRELAQTGAAWQIEGERKRYQLHPQLVGTEMSGAGERRLGAIAADRFNDQRRRRYEAATGVASVGGLFVPPIAFAEPVILQREVFELLALADLAPTGRRVLDILLARHSPHDGTAEISQREMVSALGASYPAVNRGVRELGELGLVWGLKGNGGGRYQLHPVLTDGAVSSPVMNCPPIPEVGPDVFSALRRERYAVQIGSLRRTA
ncbi:hypothetical protein [Kitasatospora kifunensis]|uniref:DNA-binding IclR family transcriptional regulator n=1 Tax=Kitasatospora kifunensis TaxID=58351 RepID=A0A7W7RC74_KITKI|nr:hypothetical protein [Kitasatospora kifunensis]MBB4929150.1 DNA-binding IclR family transcriptional regulator [Kitasatospora kifunensis]